MVTTLLLWYVFYKRITKYYRYRKFLLCFIFLFIFVSFVCFLLIILFWSILNSSPKPLPSSSFSEKMRWQRGWLSPGVQNMMRGYWVWVSFESLMFSPFVRIKSYKQILSYVYVCFLPSEVSLQLKNLPKNIYKNKCREDEIDIIFNSPCLFTSNALIQFK